LDGRGFDVASRADRAGISMLSELKNSRRVLIWIILLLAGCSTPVDSKDGRMQGCRTNAGCAVVGSDAEPLSCAGLAADCGPSANESCCASPTVTGGTFNRDDDASYPAKITSFRLDKYEVTVGRFRKFVAAVVAGWLPAAGSGKHTYLNGGNGLADSAAAGYEPGWDTTWNASLPPSKATWDSSSYLACDSAYATWTPSSAGNEDLPINCINWYQSAAFCIWDRGFVPSQAEWDYAEAGGSEQRLYPWGSAVPSGNATLAVFGCYYHASGNCVGFTNLAPVGSLPAGNGLYGQADLAGNVAEWNLDWDTPNAVSNAECNDCAYLQSASARVGRGGSFFFYASLLPSTFHDSVPPAARSFDLGLRCGRTP
jgi:formylglycine-generating enzyme required for sulfatase activity